MNRVQEAPIRTKTYNSYDPFGVLAFLHWNHDWNNWHFKGDVLNRAVQQIKELGVSFVRLDILWADIHRGNRQYDFSAYDRIISLLHKERIHVLALLQYNKYKDLGKKEVWNHPPDSFEEFADYVGATVDHFKPWIKHWEIWNEPNHSFYWIGPPDDLKSYCRLLELSYAAAKRADPSCVVLNGGFTTPVAQCVDLLYRNGGKSFTDIISIHTFLNPADPDFQQRFGQTILDVDDIKARNGDDAKKVWITEMGCPGLPQGIPAQNWFAGPGLSEEEQADWIETQYTLIKKHPSVEKLFWAFYRDTRNHFKDATDYLGLVRFDLTPKPAFKRLKRLIRAHRAG